MRGFSIVAVCCAALAGCGVENAELEGDDLGQAESALDSFTRPTAQGELFLLEPSTSALSSRTGFHEYTFEGTAGWRIKFTEKSKNWKTWLRVTAPGGQSWVKVGTRSGSAPWTSTLDLKLPRTGTYKVFVTSSTNQSARTRRSTGEYTIGATGTVACGVGTGPGCPAHLKCLGARSATDANGTCVQEDRCRSISDCAGLIHPMCYGGWTCDGRTSAGIGTCAYHCGVATDECASLQPDQCGQNPRCEVYATGCENVSCDPSAETCHPCDPIAACRMRQVGGVGERCGTRGALPCADDLFCNWQPGAICGHADAPGTCAAKPEVCSKELFQVCGCDGVTYDNKCFAAKAGTGVMATGACPITR